MNLRFLLLMRHAKHTRGRLDEPKPKDPTPLDDIACSLRELAQTSATMRATRDAGTSDSSDKGLVGVLTAEGRYETLVAANRLKDFLPEWTQKLTLGAVVHYDHPEVIEARETAMTFCNGFGFPVGYEATPSKLLGPETAPADLGKKKGGSLLVRAVKKEASKLVAKNGKNAVLFVGHQPAVGWLASALLKQAVPIAQSEILCIDLEPKGKPTLSWCVSPAEDTVLEALREKIKSKMSLANLLSGFITAGLGVLLAMLADNKKMTALGAQGPVVFIAAGCLLLAVALYLRTMFSYDALLMPVRFWAESASGASYQPPWIVARPPSGAHWILYQNMIRVWQWQFIPATFLTLSGLFMLWGGVASAALQNSYYDQRLWFRAITLSLPVAMLLWILCRKAMDIGRGVRRGWRNFFSCRGLALFRYVCGPWLGSED